MIVGIYERKDEINKSTTRRGESKNDKKMRFCVSRSGAGSRPAENAAGALQLEIAMSGSTYGLINSTEIICLNAAL